MRTFIKILYTLFLLFFILVCWTGFAFFATQEGSLLQTGVLIAAEFILIVSIFQTWRRKPNIGDLVQIKGHFPTCHDCSVYQSRVYSVSGRDKRFPPFKVLPHHGVIHEGCAHTLEPWIESAMTPEEVNSAIAYSNRPFVPSFSKRDTARLAGQAYRRG